MGLTTMKPSATFVTVVPSVVAIALVIHFAKPPWSAARIIGLVLMVTGFGFLTVARINLGNSFSVTPQATALVTKGIYARIRNPIYVFSTIGLAGASLFSGKPILLLLLLPLIVMQTRRARSEARLLEQRFGEAYRRYKAETWF